MATTLSRSELLSRLLSAIDMGGWQSLVLSSANPVRVRVFRGDEQGFMLRAHIWNCTHGGASRAADEYRIQLTSPITAPRSDEVALLLGWHEDYGVFVGWDVVKHINQAGRSPSAQVKEETLLHARADAFSIQERQSNEIAVAFRPEFLVDYAQSVKLLHKTGSVQRDLAILNSLPVATEKAVEAVTNIERRTVVSQIFRKYRAHDFSRRVLGAYAHRCAFCGLQLELIDAAHIVPVAEPLSTDETTNGIALCKIHHSAFDRNLISFDESYRTHISGSEVTRLTDAKRVGGLSLFKRQIRSVIVLPADRRDYPKPAYIRRARAIRRWAA